MEDLNNALKELNHASGDLDSVIEKLNKAKDDLADFVEESAQIVDALEQYKNKMEEENMIDDFFIKTISVNRYKDRLKELQKIFHS